MMEEYDYDAWGKPHFYSASSGWSWDLRYSEFGNRFLFTGREWLGDLKLYDYRNRLYQPELGRFLQPDPKEFAAGDYNLYRYCHNDPVNRSDPTGLWSEEAHDALLQHAFGGLLSPRDIATIAAASARLDRETSLPSRFSNLHSMRMTGQSPAAAIAGRDNFIKAEIRAAQAAAAHGNRNSALAHFG